MIQDIRRILSFFWMKMCKTKIEILSKLQYLFDNIILPTSSISSTSCFLGSTLSCSNKPPPKKHLLETCGTEHTNPPLLRTSPTLPKNCLVNAACSVKDHPADKEGRSKAWRAARTSRGQAWETREDELWRYDCSYVWWNDNNHRTI